MQITINTDTDDLPAVIRMLQAYGGHQGTMALVADVKELSQKVESAARSMGIPGVPADLVYTGAALQAAVLPPCSAHANEPIEVTEEQRRELNAAAATAFPGELGRTPPRSAHANEPTPEQVFAAPKSLFDAPPHSDVTVDAAGLPWDARIHSGAKSKLANGNWKLLRGVDPALVASVEAELRGAPKPAAPTTPAAALGAERAIAPPPPAPVAPPVGVPSPPAPLPTPPAPKPITNAAELVAAVMDKRCTTDQVNAACRAVGVDNVASLLAKQEMLPLVLRELGVPV